MDQLNDWPWFVCPPWPNPAAQLRDIKVYEVFATQDRDFLLFLPSLYPAELWPRPSSGPVDLHVSPNSNKLQPIHRLDQPPPGYRESASAVSVPRQVCRQMLAVSLWVEAVQLARDIQGAMRKTEVFRRRPSHRSVILTRRSLARPNPGQPVSSKQIMQVVQPNNDKNIRL